MNKEILWTVHTNTDLTEGRGRQFVKHFCKTEATARRLAKRGYVQGSDCPISTAEVLILDGQRVLPAALISVEMPTREDDAAQAIIDRRNAAIEKAREAGLSDEDIAALRRDAE